MLRRGLVELGREKVRIEPGEYGVCLNFLTLRDEPLFQAAVSF